EMLQKDIKESSEPVVGCLGVFKACTVMAFSINRETAKSECACSWGGWGRLSVDGSGQYNPDRSEGPWGRAAGPHARRRSKAHRSPTQSGGYSVAAAGAKGDGKPAWAGNATPDIPALKPYRLCGLLIYVAFGLVRS